MSEVVVRPLVVVREHAGGAFSAHPAAAPGLVCHGSDRDAVLGELALFLSSYLPKAGAEVVQRLMLPEEALLEQVPVALPYRGPARLKRLDSTVELGALVVPGRRGARWVLVPALNHVCYVPEERVGDTHESVAREIERLAHASDFDGGGYLDLLPPVATSIERLEVALEERPGEAEKGASLARAAERKKRDAGILLERIGRVLSPAKTAVLHRDERVKTLRALLEGKERASVVLIGPEGAGKSALVQAAVGTKADPLGRPVYVTSGAELVAGQSFLGQLEEQVEAVMKAVELLDAVLYFEALDDLFAGRPGGYQDLASLMRRFVSEGRVRIVGELTAERHDRLQHRNVSFFSTLHQLSVEPLTRAQTLDVLRARKLRAETASVLLEITERYHPYAAQPGSAVRFAEELAALQTGAPEGEIEPDDVYRATSARTGVPEFLLRDERSLLLGDVVKHFRSQLIGQQEAIDHVAEVLCRVKAGVAPTGRPLATFLFVGPTGVGKTELAKALARFLFGSAERLARFDMSEYRGPLAAERLIRGSDSADGVLTRRIRQQPFTVLLLDEIEKADSGVFDLLLQVFGEGRLSDAQGKLAHFSNAIIIMTSNLGSQHQGAPAGFGSQPALGREHYLREVREHFRPEFVNRLDRIVAFESLTLEQMREVTELSIDKIKRREGLDERNVGLQVSRGAALKLAEDGYSRAYGARGLRRHLEQALAAPIATLLAGLGERAAGSLVSVRLAKEEETETGELRRHEQGGLVLTAFSRPDPRRRNVTGAADICRLRREVTRWSKLSPLAEVHERIAEITAELSSTQNWKRAQAMGKIYGDLSAEHARLTSAMTPLDEAQKELETIEGMVVAGLDEGGAPELFAEDARRAHGLYKGRLVTALHAMSTENEITLHAHELDDGRPLARWLMPFLGYTRDKAWEAIVHFHRDEPALFPDWPEDRRWGPERPREEVIERFGQGQELPFRNVLIRVRGHAAGGLLEFCDGRWVYPLGEKQTDLWVRAARDRFEIKADDYAQLNALVDPAIGRRQHVRFDLTPHPDVGPDGEIFEDVDEHNLFQNYERMCFRWVVAKMGS